MIKNGKLGNSTLTGKKEEKNKFEELRKFLSQKNMKLNYIDKNIYNASKKNKIILEIFSQEKLNFFLKRENINWKERVSTQFKPDMFIVNNLNKKIFIIEIKTQNVSGSVDEKLQTCDFKNKQYIKLFINSKFENYKKEYWYMLNNWFSDKKYLDVLNYIKEVKCFYTFESYDSINFFK